MPEVKSSKHPPPGPFGLTIANQGRVGTYGSEVVGVDDEANLTEHPAGGASRPAPSGH